MTHSHGMTKYFPDCKRPFLPYIFQREQFYFSFRSGTKKSDERRN